MRTSGARSAARATSASSVSTSSKLCLGLSGRELRQHPCERRQTPYVDLDVAERLSERRSQRHIREVSLELRCRRPANPHVPERAAQLLEDARLAESALSLDEDEPKRPVESAPHHPLERLELRGSAEQAHGGAAGTGPRSGVCRGSNDARRPRG